MPVLMVGLSTALSNLLKCLITNSRNQLLRWELSFKLCIKVLCFSSHVQGSVSNLQVLGSMFTFGELGLASKVQT
jgi:hypothetical protein